MSGTIYRLPAARRDLVDALTYIGQGSVESARRFRMQCETTLQMLADMPQMGPRFDSDHPLCVEIRFFPVEQFRKYILFYRPVADGIELVRVLNGNRDIRSILIADFGISGAESDESDHD